MKPYNVQQKGINYLPVHPLGAQPQTQAGIYQSIYDKAGGGYMHAMPWMLSRMGQRGRLDRTQRAMAQTANMLLNTAPGTPGFTQAMNTLSRRWSPQQYRIALSRAGMGDAFRPENMPYWNAISSQSPAQQAWRSVGSADYMRNQIRNRRMRGSQFIGGMPAFEWDRYGQAAGYGLEKLRQQMLEGQIASMAPQHRSAIDAILEGLRGGNLDIGQIIKMITANLGDQSG